MTPPKPKYGQHTPESMWKSIESLYQEHGRGAILVYDNALYYLTLLGISDIPITAKEREELRQRIADYDPNFEALVLEINPDGSMRCRSFRRRTTPTA